MNTSITSNKVIVIVGPTGSGKTGVSIEIAKAIHGEIISADSRAIYKGMDIGTAKPSISEQDGVPHFGLDLVEPGERFTVADWKTYAEQKISEIRARGHVPIIVGGTGLYVDALVYNYEFGDGSRSEINGAHREDNVRRNRGEVCSNYLLIGVKWESEELRKRLKMRLEKMFSPELFEETQKLVEQYGWGSQAMTSDIYEFAYKYLNGEMTLDEAKEKCFYEDWHLAKRQMTWFKRNDKIVWLPLDKIYEYVIKCIQNEQRK